MIRASLIALAFIATLVSSKSQAVVWQGSKYFEVCVSEFNECVVGAVSKYGDVGVLIRESQQPPILLGDVWKPGPNGFRVAKIRDGFYNILRDAGLERFVVSAENTQAEIDAIQEKIDDSLVDCLLSSASCAGGGLLALGTGPLGLGLAGIVCWQSYRQCKALDKANVDLFAQRKALLEKLKEEGEKEKEKDGEGSSGGGGAEREGERTGPPSSERAPGSRETAPTRGSEVTIRESRPTGGVPLGRRPVLF